MRQSLIDKRIELPERRAVAAAERQRSRGSAAAPRAKRFSTSVISTPSRVTRDLKPVAISVFGKRRRQRERL